MRQGPRAVNPESAIARIGICQLGLVVAQSFEAQEPTKPVKAEIQSDGGIHNAFRSIYWFASFLLWRWRMVVSRLCL